MPVQGQFSENTGNSFHPMERLPRIRSKGYRQGIHYFVVIIAHHLETNPVPVAAFFPNILVQNLHHPRILPACIGSVTVTMIQLGGPQTP